MVFSSKTLLFFGLLQFAYLRTYAQCTSVNINSPSTSCRNGYFDVSTSTSASSYSWQFCTGDLRLSPAVAAAVTSSLTNPYDICVVQDGNMWYGFGVGYNSSTVNRINLGSDPNNDIPNDISLGNPGNFLNHPTSIKVKKMGGSWYGLIYNEGNRTIVLLQFGGTLSNTPTSSVIATNVGGSEGSIDFAQTGSNSFVVLVSNSGGVVTNLFFSNGLDGGVTGTNSSSVGGYLVDVEIIEGCNAWSAFVLIYDKRTLARLDFGNDLTSSPTIVVYSSNLFSFGPYRLWMGKEGDYLNGMASNINGGVANIDIGVDITNSSPVITDFGNLSGAIAASWSVYAIKNLGRWIGFTFNGYTSQLYRLTFPQVPCDCSISTSSVQSPGLIGYSLSGTKYPVLSVTYADGTIESKTFPVQIQSLDASSLQINFDGYCVNSNVNFTTQSSGSLVNPSWSFGDGNTSSQPNPTYIFSTAASYTVVLTASNDVGCVNTAQTTVNVYNRPTSSFNLPVASPFCTNQNYTYTNTSTFDNGSNPTWQWSVNGTNVATTKDLNYAFTSSSAQSVALTASIPGCSTQSTQNINTIVNGPLVTFSSPSTGCKGSGISFTNTTAGTILSQSWSFGDGNTSTQSNTSNTYLTTGPFTVSLSTTNSNGCQNSATKNIAIYSIPQPDFAIEAPPLSCERSPSQLDNLTPALVDSNISSWSWSFGDANIGSSTLKNPTYTYASAGSYNVSLQATSNFGCTKSIQKSVSISPSPVANFANSAACVNQGTRFTDASSGSVSFYQWTIQNNIFSGSTPSYTFRSSGTFPVTLTITSTNGCTNQITKNISVPVLPVVDFAVQAPCTGHPSVFKELNPNTADPAVAWHWNFGQASGTGSPVSYQFASEGGYTVTMSTTRQSGCTYSTSENISISAGPIASFTPSTFAGPAPLNVLFNNTSTADTYLWSFGDQAQTTNTTSSPGFTYTTLGKYKALLTAKNNLGCSDTLSTEIYVVIPYVDVAVNSLSLTNDLMSNTAKPVVTILNSGNMPLIDPVVVFDLGGGASIKQKVSGMIRPGKSLSQTLGLQIVPSSIKYVCAEIEAADDVNLYNNRQCVSLSHENMVMAPYPNPAISGHVTLEWIGASQENAKVTIFRSNGEIVFEQHLDSLQTGLGQLDISTSSLSNGLYLIQFVGSTVTKTFRIVIAN